MKQAGAAGVVVHRGDPDLEGGQYQQPEPQLPASPAQQLVAKAAGVVLSVAAVTTAFFGPDYNADKPFFDLSASTLNIIHWVLNSIWGLAFSIYAKYGAWSTLEPFQRSCHRLAATAILVAMLLLDIHNSDKKIPVSFYPIVFTLLVEAMHLCIDITCHVVAFLIGIVVVVMQTARELLAAFWARLEQWFKFGLAIRIGTRG